MTLQEFINKYNWKKVGDGQCGALVRQYWIEVDGTNPPSYPNSKDYWFNPVPGYDKVHDPQPGNIAIYDGHGTFVEGHSAIYVDGRVFEQNADPDGSSAHLFNRANTYLLGYLRNKKGNNIVNYDQVDSMAHAYLNDSIANNPGLKYYVGQDVGAVIAAFNGAPERAAYLKHIGDLEKGVLTRQAVLEYIQNNLK